MGTGYRYTTKTLWGLAKSKELGLTKEELHLLVACETGKDSIRELNRSELPYVCHILQKQKDDAKRQEGRPPERRGNPQTGRQRREAGQLKEKLGWEEWQVRALCHRMHRVGAVEWLIYYQCQGLIETMKTILERRSEKEDGRG